MGDNAAVGRRQHTQQQQQPHPYVYQYQHFDPRSHVEVPHHPTAKKASRRRPTAGGGKAHHLHAGDPPVHDHRLRGYYGGAGVGNINGGGNIGAWPAVPPTVHLPNVPGAGLIKDVSPLTNHHLSSGTKRGGGGGDDGGGGRQSSSLLLPDTPSLLLPETPHFGDVPSPDDDGLSSSSAVAVAIAELESGVVDGTVKSSPLDLLSSVSTSPVIANLPGKVSTRPPSYGGGGDGGAGAAQSYEMRHHHYPGGHSSYTYPAPPTDHHYHPNDNPSDSITADLSATPPMAQPRQSNLELMLSAANTLDIDESKRAKRRKLSAENANTVKKRLLLLNNRHVEPNATASAGTATAGIHNLFSVGGYPPGFDPSTLPPTRSTVKPSSKASKAKLIDSEAVAQALQASTLARQALERPRVGKQLLLSMALVRTNPRTPPSCYPAHGTILTDRFHWAAFPPLDAILRTNMRRYYELSTNKCQSKDQQEFNNVLVMNVKREAHKYGWEFDREAFDDKKIRDRIRCFYKRICC
ncbi:hypothetical protein ACHAW5_003672 [Stephanodiscus triporus]|uniref:Uncharacterized protein n=1 Tax=Stephanodiscus triporus TaxID=2934178 RepID=A0ABD3NFE1_9STRA